MHDTPKLYATLQPMTPPPIITTRLLSGRVDDDVEASVVGGGDEAIVELNDRVNWWTATLGFFAVFSRCRWFGC